MMDKQKNSADAEFVICQNASGFAAVREQREDVGFCSALERLEHLVEHTFGDLGWREEERRAKN